MSACHLFSKSNLLLLLTAASIGAIPQAPAQEIRSIVLMNNGKSPADIWVNMSYQGYAPAGELVQVDKLGFTTQDSGRTLPDGTRTPDVASHGGWSGYGDVTVTICQCDRYGKAHKMEVVFPKEFGNEVGDDKEFPLVWFGESSAGPKPNVTRGMEIHPIYKGIEGNDCGSSALQGQARTNVTVKKVIVLPTGWRCFYAGTLHSSASPGADCGNASLGGLWEWIDGFTSPLPIREMTESEAKRNNLPYLPQR